MSATARKKESPATGLGSAPPSAPRATVGAESASDDAPFPRRRDSRRGIYLGEGFWISVFLSEKPVRAQVVDVNPGGLGIVLARGFRTAADLMGDSVRIEYRDRGGNDFVARGVVRAAADVILRKQELLRIGVEFVDDGGPQGRAFASAAARLSPPYETGSAEEGTGAAFPCAAGMRPVGHFDDPFFFNERIAFEVAELTPQGLVFRTGLESKTLLPNLTVRASLFVPKLGAFEATMRILRAEADGREACYLAWARWVKPDPALLDALCEYLVFACPTASVRSLKKAGFGVAKMRRALSFKCATTREELRAILKLRQMDAAARGDAAALSGPEAFLDSYDDRARKILCRVGRKIVAACRLVFPEGAPAKSEFFADAAEFPPAVREGGCVEVSRLNWHAHYASPDLFFSMIQNLVRVTLESGERHMLVAIPAASWPIYRKLGFRVLEQNVMVPSVGPSPSVILRLDVPKVLRGLEEIDTATFKNVYLPVARHLGLATYR